MSFTIDFCSLFRAVASDCDLDSYTVQYVLTRLRNEGVHFWTVTLPKLAKYILSSIELGYFDIRNSGITDFAWKGRFPRIFRGLLGSVFSLRTGKILESPSPVALWQLRQILEYCYKLALSYSDASLKRAEEDYESTQKEVADHQYDSAFVERLRKNAETYYPGLFRSPDVFLAAGPRFGPGSFATTGLDVRAPFYEWKQLEDRKVGTCSRGGAPYSGYFKPYPSAPTHINVVNSTRVCEVLFVPKDSRGPRVISKEPPHLIRAQMAFFEYVSKYLEQVSFKRIGFSDQTINKRLACAASIDRRNSTLDLEKGSDRVMYQLIRRIFRNSPAIQYFLKHFRSTHYKLPSGKIGVLHSLAGMGSGLTFPMLGFICHHSIVTYVSMRTNEEYSSVAKQVYSYGDDVVVPTRWYDYAKHALSLCGLRVNVRKSFAHGPFRESCGGDYLNGVECTPVRLRCGNAALPEKLRRGLILSSEDCNESNLLVSLEAHASELYLAGMFNTSNYIYAQLSKHVFLPWKGVGSPVLGRVTNDTAKILMQGHRSADGSTYMLRAHMKLPVIYRTSRACPYKFLANRLKPRLGSGEPIRTSFGEIAIPRRQRIVYRRISTVALQPLVASPLVVLP